MARLFLLLLIAVGITRLLGMPPPKKAALAMRRNSQAGTVAAAQRQNQLVTVFGTRTRSASEGAIVAAVPSRAQTPAERQRRSRANRSFAETQARKAANAANMALTRAVSQGPYIYAMPLRPKALPMDEVPPNVEALGDNAIHYFRHYSMPSDAYFDTFETDAYAAHALFWAKMGNYRFSDYRDIDFADLAHDTTKSACRLHAGSNAPLTTAANPYMHNKCTDSAKCPICLDELCKLCVLENALLDEAGIDDADYSRFMLAYTQRMDPAQPAVACGCCGVMDVPVTGISGEESEAIGILSFTKVNLRSSTSSSQHTCRGKCSPDCPCFLAPLEYTSAELDAYDLPFPTHIIPPTELSDSALLQWQEEQHADWLSARRIISNVGVDVHGTAVTRVGFGPADSARDCNGDVIPVDKLSDGPRASLLHLYPELVAITTPATITPALYTPTRAASALGTVATTATFAIPAETFTNICSPCMRALAERRRPHVSIANGWDLGTLSYADMPALSWAEKRAISKTRILCTALNIDLPRRSGYHSHKANCIAFADSAADTCGSVMPSAEFAGRDTFVSIQGPPGAFNAGSLEGILQRHHRGHLRVDPANVNKWLKALRMLSVEVYGGVDILSAAANAREAAELERALIATMELLPTSQTVATEGAIACSDVTRPQNDVAIDVDAAVDTAGAATTGVVVVEAAQETSDESTSDADVVHDLTVTMVGNRYQQNDVAAATLRILQAVQAAVPHVTATGSNACRSGADDIATQPSSGVGSNTEADPVVHVALRRDAREPLDTYGRNTLFYGSHPWVFPLGQGCGPKNGPLDSTTRLFQLRHYNRAASRDELLMHTVHNQKMLADSGRVAAATVRSDRGLLHKFIGNVEAPTYPAAIAYGVAHPESNEAKMLARQFAPLIMLSGSRVPFSPLERGTKAATELVALTRFFGYGNTFWTVGPDEKNNVIVARMTFRHDLHVAAATGNAVDTPSPFPRTTNSAAATASDYWHATAPGSSTSFFSDAAGATAGSVDATGATAGSVDAAVAAVGSGNATGATAGCVDATGATAGCVDATGATAGAVDAAVGSVKFRKTTEAGHDIHTWQVAVSDAIMLDPVAVALACQRMVAALEEALFGVSRKGRRTTPQLSSLPRGAFGRPQAWFHVTEVNGRNQLHWHGILWAGLPHWITQRGAGSSNLESLVTELLGRAYTAQVPGKLHVARLLRLLDGTQPEVRAASFSPPPLQGAYESAEAFAERIKKHGEAALVTVNIHSHCQTCHKSLLGETECRLCYGRATASSAKPTSLHLRTVANLHYPDGDVATAPPHYAQPKTGETLDRRLMRLAAPGGDFRVHEYPLLRPLVTVEGFQKEATVAGGASATAAADLEMLDPALAVEATAAATTETAEAATAATTTEASDIAVAEASARLFLPLLLRQYDRVASVFSKLGLPCEPLSDPASSVTVSNELSILMRRVILGDYYGPTDSASAAHETTAKQILEAAVLTNEEVESAIKAVPKDRQLDFFDYLSQQNALLGESNLAVAAALGCNFNAQPLVSTESASRAMFYILDYVTKDSLKPAKLLPFIKAARERCQQYEGHAPAGENPMAGSRPHRRLISVSQNGVSASVEYATQQCALNNGGFPAHDSSVWFSYVFTAPLVRVVRRATATARGDCDGDAIDASVDAGLGPRVLFRESGAAAGAVPAAIDMSPEASAAAQSVAASESDHEQDAYDAFDSENDDEIRQPRPGTATLHRSAQDVLTQTAQHIEYAHRSSNLAWLSPTSYACSIRRELKKKHSVSAPARATEGDASEEDASEGDMCDAEDATDEAEETVGVKRGRHSNLRIEFDNTIEHPYPLGDKFIQHVASQQTVPIFGGLSAVPNWPDFTAINAEDTRAAEARFAEWVFATLIPHPAPGHSYEDAGDDIVDRLARTLQQLETGTWRLVQHKDSIAAIYGFKPYCLDNVRYYQPPPGFTDLPPPLLWDGNTPIPPSSSPPPETARVYEKFQISEKSNWLHDARFDGIRESQQTVARFIASLARGFRRPSRNERRVPKMWRARAAQQWALQDPERALFPTVYVRNQQSDPEARGDSEGLITDAEITEFNIDALRALMDADDLLLTNAAHVRLVAFLHRITIAHGVVRDTESMRGAAGASRDNGAAQVSPIGTRIVISQDDIAGVAARIAADNLQPAVLPDLPPAIAPTDATADLAAAGPAHRALLELQARPTNAPNAGQVAALRIMADHFDDVHGGRPTDPPFLFLEGAGGTGKSFLFSCLEVLANACGRRIAPTAMTGVACTAIPTQQGARTTQSCFKLGIDPHKIQPLGDTQFSIVNGVLGQPIAVIIDEISFAKAWILGAVDKRMRQLTGVDADFGGVAVICAGDFFQIPPVGGRTLYDRVMFDRSARLEGERADDEEADLQRAALPGTAGSAANEYTHAAFDARGAELWERVRRVQLLEQVRCLDSRHTGFPERMRLGDMTGLARYLLEHRLKTADIEKFGDAPVISPGNPEREHLTPRVLSEFAAARGDRVISWRLNNHFSGRKAISLQQSLHSSVGSASTTFDTVADLVYKNNPELTAHFVAGSPILLTSNMNPTRGLANGVPAEQYDLHWPESVRQRAVAWLADHPGDVMLPPGLEPAHVLALLPTSTDARYSWPADLNLAACAPEVNGTAASPPAEVIVPIACESTKVHVRSGGFDNKGKPKTCAVSVETPQYDFNFIGTCHKSQGRTLPKVIISLLDRPGKPSRNGKEGFHALYVALTRVRSGDDFRVILEDNPRDVNFVNALKPPTSLLAYREGFDTDGRWHRDVALAAFERLGGRIPLSAARVVARAPSVVPPAAAPSAGTPATHQRGRKGPKNGSRKPPPSAASAPRATAIQPVLPSAAGPSAAVPHAATPASPRGRIVRNPHPSVAGPSRATPPRPPTAANATAATPQSPTMAHPRAGQKRRTDGARETPTITAAAPRAAARADTSNDHGQLTMVAVCSLTDSDDKVVNAVARARQILGDWHPVLAVERPPLTLDEALRTVAGLGPAGPQRTHSRFFVPFLRAAQGLPSAEIPFLRGLVGADNWDAAIVRTTAVFQAVGVTPAVTQWNAAGYVGEHGQEAMLNVESALIHVWAEENAASLVTGGALYVQLIQQRIAEAEQTVGAADAAAASRLRPRTQSATQSSTSSPLESARTQTSTPTTTPSPTVCIAAAESVTSTSRPPFNLFRGYPWQRVYQLWEKDEARTELARLQQGFTLVNSYLDFEIHHPKSDYIAPNTTSSHDDSGYRGADGVSLADRIDQATILVNQQHLNLMFEKPTLLPLTTAAAETASLDHLIPQGATVPGTLSSTVCCSVSTTMCQCQLFTSERGRRNHRSHIKVGRPRRSHAPVRPRLPAIPASRKQAPARFPPTARPRRLPSPKLDQPRPEHAKLVTSGTPQAVQPVTAPLQPVGGADSIEVRRDWQATMARSRTR